MQTIKTIFYTSLMLVFSATMAWAMPVSPVEKSKAAEMEQALDKENLERELGRKLNFVERIVLKRAKKKLKKQAQREPESASTLSILALIFGSLALPLLFVPSIGFFLLLIFGIGATVMGAVGQDGSRSKSDKFAKIGMWLGISSLIVGLVILLLAFSVILAWAAG